MLSAARSCEPPGGRLLCATTVRELGHQQTGSSRCCPKGLCHSSWARLRLLTHGSAGHGHTPGISGQPRWSRPPGAERPRPLGQRRKAAPPSQHCSALSPRLCPARPGTKCSQGSSQPSLVPLARMCQKAYWFESTEKWPPPCVEMGGGGGQGGFCLPASVRNCHRSPPPLRPGQKLTMALDAGLLKVHSEPGAAGTAQSLPRTGL